MVASGQKVVKTSVVTVTVVQEGGGGTAVEGARVEVGWLGRVVS